MKAPTAVRRALGSSCQGQSIVEFALVLPFLMVVVLGVTEVGYALLDSHIVTKLTRESSNMISRDTTLDDAVTALDFGSDSIPLDRDDAVVLAVPPYAATALVPELAAPTEFRSTWPARIRPSERPLALAVRA